VTVEQALRRCAGGLVVLIAVAGAQASCAHRIGKEAAAGAVAELKQRAAENPEGAPMRIAGANAVEGAIAALDTPEQRAKIQRLVTEAVSAAATTAVEDATRLFVAQLGPDGQGPLAVSLARTGERISASAVGSVGGELAALVPECAGPDQLGCIERRLQQTARTTAASFTTGVKDSLGWHFLLIAFSLGVASGVIGAWLWSMRYVRRRTLRTA
jgi:hypothetical protein